jgi:hypothetical protein
VWGKFSGIRLSLRAINASSVTEINNQDDQFLIQNGRQNPVVPDSIAPETTISSKQCSAGPRVFEIEA